MRLARLLSIAAVALLFAVGDDSGLSLAPKDTALSAPPPRVQICHSQRHIGDYNTGFLRNINEQCIADGGRVRSVSARSCSTQHDAAPLQVGRVLYTCDGPIILY